MGPRGARDKPIRISPHAAEQAWFRGTAAAEIERAIREGPWRPADGGRRQARLSLAYKQTWNGKHYARKVVRPIFVEREHEIVVVTVYTYYEA